MSKNNALSLINELTSLLLAGKIEPEDLDTFISAYRRKPQETIGPLPPDFKLDEFLAAVEKEKVVAAIQLAEDDRIAAAKLLGITFRSLRYRCAKLGIEPAPQDQDTD